MGGVDIHCLLCYKVSGNTETSNQEGNEEMRKTIVLAALALLCLSPLSAEAQRNQQEPSHSGLFVSFGYEVASHVTCVGSYHGTAADNKRGFYCPENYFVSERFMSLDGGYRLGRHFALDAAVMMPQGTDVDGSKEGKAILGGFRAIVPVGDFDLYLGPQFGGGWWAAETSSEVKFASRIRFGLSYRLPKGFSAGAEVDVPMAFFAKTVHDGGDNLHESTTKRSAIRATFGYGF